MRTPTRALVMMLVSAMVAATLSVAGANPASASEPTAVTRIEGTDRYDTAAKIAVAAFPGGTNTVILVSGENFPDALAANGLGGQRQAAVLMTTKNSLPAATEAALGTLKPQTVIILGGTVAVSTSVATRLATLGYNVDRIEGADRYKTAVAVANRLTVPTINGRRTVIVANSLTAADSVAMSPGAYRFGIPLVLTTADTLQADTESYIDSGNIQQVLLLGGTSAVSDAVQSRLAGKGIQVVRLGGSDRYQTSARIAGYLLGLTGFTPTTFILANGLLPFDALGGGQLGGRNGQTIVLTNGASLTNEVASFLQANAELFDALTVLGGPNAVATSAVTQTQAAGQVGSGDGGGNGGGNTGPTGGPTGNAVTVLPELQSAVIQSTDGTGTVVRFTFDENISFFAPVAGSFTVYRRDTGAASTGNTVSATTGSTTDIKFNAINTQPLADALIFSTVAPGAVKDNDGRSNPVGQANIGSGVAGVTTNFAAGITDAPDLTTVSGFRNFGAGTTAVDFTFDEAADVAAGGYTLTNVNGEEIVCGNPVVGPSGGNAPGGDNTTKHTVVCPDYTTGTSLTPSTTNTARGRVPLGAVDENAVGNLANVAQAAPVGNSGNTADPDISTVVFQPNGTNPDTVLVTFDENVEAAVVSASFVLYNKTATLVPIGAAARNPVNKAQVLVTYAEGALANAVGLQVLAAAVTSEDTSTANAFDEEGVANSVTTGGITAGDVPQRNQLKEAQILAVKDGFGATIGWNVKYIFEADLTTVNTVGSIQLLRNDGSRMDCTAATVATGNPAGQNNFVTCTAFNDVTLAAAATVAQVGAGVRAVVLENAIDTVLVGTDVVAGGNGTNAS